jgi:hypothetical protein
MPEVNAAIHRHPTSASNLFLIAVPSGLAARLAWLGAGAIPRQ